MISLIVSWMVSAGALMLASRMFDSVRLRGDFADALWVAALYAVLSFVFSWIIFGLLGIATLGLGFVFHLVTKLVTAALVLRMTSGLTQRLDIDGFFPALGVAACMAVAAEVAQRLLPLLGLS